jgi:hypothetical protein
LERCEKSELKITHHVEYQRSRLNIQPSAGNSARPPTRQCGGATWIPFSNLVLQHWQRMRRKLTMPESSLSNEKPSRATLEQALRNVVQTVYKTGNLEELTIKRVRIAAEKLLNLQDGFYKSEPTWNEESKRIIRSEVVSDRLG